MKQVWNTETQNEFGVYYRPEDVDQWACTVDDDFSKPNFTNIRPPHKWVDWDGAQWVENVPLRENAEALAELAATDDKMIRVIEDSIERQDAIVAAIKAKIPDFDPPGYSNAVRNKLAARKAAREKLIQQPAPGVGNDSYRH
jgi:hypothetical protein